MGVGVRVDGAMGRVFSKVTSVHRRAFVVVVAAAGCLTNWILQYLISIGAVSISVFGGHHPPGTQWLVMWHGAVQVPSVPPATPEAFNQLINR